MINWTVRIKNKNFWLTIIPAVLLLVQQVAAMFGAEINLGDLGDKLLLIVNQIFVILVILGIIQDPTTATFADSAQAMTYKTPKQ